MSADPSDWPTCRAEFHRLFGHQLGRRQPGHPKGANFITNELLGFVEHDGTTVEVTTGWFLDSRVYGLVWPRLPDGSPDPRDRMAGSLLEAQTILAPAR